MIIATLSTCFTTRRFFQVLCQSLHGYSLIGDFFPFPFSFFSRRRARCRQKPIITANLFSYTDDGRITAILDTLALEFSLFFFSSSKEKKMVENFVLSNEEEAVKKLFDERDVT